MLTYQHLLTHYKKGSDNGLIADEISLIEFEYEDENKFSRAKDISLPNLSNNIVSLGSEFLTIKLPNGTNAWYRKNNYLFSKSWTESSPALTKTYKTTKEWSGIWIEDSSKSSQGMFQDIEVFIKDMSYFQVFCKGSSCGNGERNKVYTAKASEGSFAVPQTWNEAFNTTAKKLGQQQQGMFVHQTKPARPVLSFIEGSQGEWVDANSFCKVEDESGMDDKKLNELKLYCSKYKN